MSEEIMEAIEVAYADADKADARLNARIRLAARRATAHGSAPNAGRKAKAKA